MSERKPQYELLGTKTWKQLRQKMKNKQIIKKYLNEQHHGIKRNKLCRIKISQNFS